MLSKKKRLFFLALSVFIPPICVMLLAAADLLYSVKGVETLARSYVEHVTGNAAESIENFEGPPSHIDLTPYEHYDGYPVRNSLSGLSRLPTMFLLLDSDGSVLFGSEKLRDLVEHSKTRLPLGSAVEMYDMNGERFTITTFPTAKGRYTVVGAISWRDLPGSALRTIYLWPTLMACFALWCGLSVWRIWRRVIRPLGELESDLAKLRWGEETLGGTSTKMIYELRQVRESLTKAARDAVNKVSVIRGCMNDLVGVQEEERTKISRDIHDGPLQDVTALIQRIHLAKLPGTPPEDTKNELDLAEKIAQTTVKEMRGLCDFLNPPWLELGLEQALTELTERQSAQYGVRIFLDVEEDMDLSDAVTLAFFRVVQEAVTNSVKHGGAQNIWVDVKRGENGISLCVQDDGLGFEVKESDTANLRVEGHRGLSNMEERMTLVGGTLKIISFPGEGTCIRGVIPQNP